MNTLKQNLHNLLDGMAKEWVTFVTSDLAPYISNHELLETADDQDKNRAIINSLLVATDQIPTELLPVLLSAESSLSSEDSGMLADEIINYLSAGTTLLEELGVKINQNQIEPIGEIPKPPKFISPKVLEASSRIEKIRPKPRKGNDDPYREPTN